MNDVEIEPIAYKFRVKKDGIINEFVAIKEISEEEAEKKIKDFLEYFKPVAIRKDLDLSEKEVEKPSDEYLKDEYSTAENRWVYLLEFMQKYPEFIKTNYIEFMISKGLRFKSFARANDDFHSLKEKGLLERVPPHGWKFIGSEEKLKSFIEERPIKKITKRKIFRANMPDIKQRAHMMYKNMADKEYFTLNDWIEFMTTPPNNYDTEKVKNNFYHDIIYLAEKVKEIKTDNIGYKPKRYKIVKLEPQQVDDMMIRDLNEGQKVVLGH